MPRTTAKTEWQLKFEEKLRLFHRKNIPALAKKFLKRIDGVKGSMTTRSKKYEVACNITLEELRTMAYEAYGTPCKYSGRILKYNNMVYDHIIPISKGGTSNRDNLQIISKFSNSIKGSLTESHFYMLLEWLDTVPEELKKDISIRLAHGIC
jgi:5-methylcytosine-specific restriction endonuclease McrA